MLPLTCVSLSDKLRQGLVLSAWHRVHLYEENLSFTPAVTYVVSYYGGGREETVYKAWRHFISESLIDRVTTILICQ